ncbi:hypothetical protein WG922_18470, partial [Ramlibacter sp. AN1015]
ESDAFGRGEPAQRQEPRTGRTVRRGLPTALDAVFRRALAPDPHDRFADAGALSAALQAAFGPPLWVRARMRALPARPATSAVAALRTATGERSDWVEMAFATVCLAVLAWTANLLVSAPVPEMAGLRAQAVVVEEESRRAGREQSGRVQQPLVLAAPTPALAPAAQPPRSPVALEVAPAPTHPAAAAHADPAAPQGGAPAAGDIDVAPARGAGLHAPRSQPPAARPPKAQRVAARAPRQVQPGPAALQCRHELQLAREVCAVLRCATAAFRSHPVCVRMHAEQQRMRDQLAQSHGPP